MATVTGIGRNELAYNVSEIVGATGKWHIRLRLLAYDTNNSLIIPVVDNGDGNSRELSRVADNGDGNYDALHIMAMVIHANTGLLKP